MVSLLLNCNAVLNTPRKVSVFEVFLVLIFPLLDRIQRDTENLRIQSERGKIQTKTQNTDTFHTVKDLVGYLWWSFL